MGIEGAHVVAMVYLDRKAKTAMLADLDNGTCTRCIDRIAFGCHVVNSSVRKFAVGKRIIDDFETLLDGMAVLHRMKHRNLFGRDGILFQGGQQLFKGSLHLIYALAFLQQGIVEGRTIQHKAETAHLQGTVAEHARFFGAQD